MMENKATIKEQFKKEVLSALSELESSYKECFDSICNKKIFVEVNQERFYYYGHYWFCLELKKEQERKEDYKDVIALHIKPYRITETDLKEAQNDKGEKKDFAENGYLKEYNFENNAKVNVAYDNNSANFHKNTVNLEFQVVLIRENTSPKGPGWGTSDEWKKYDKDKKWIQKDRKYVKTDWYFPPISDKKCEKSLTELLQDALDAIYGK